MVPDPAEVPQQRTVTRLVLFFMNGLNHLCSHEYSSTDQHVGNIKETKGNTRNNFADFASLHDEKESSFLTLHLHRDETAAFPHRDNLTTSEGTCSLFLCTCE